MASGQAEVMFNGMLATLPFVKNNRLRVVAVASEQRWPSLADVPTVAEQGYAGFVTGSWQGLLAPAKTPPEAVARLNAEFSKALAVPDVAERMTAQGAEPRSMKPAQFAEFLRTDTARWAQLVKETGIKAE